MAKAHTHIMFQGEADAALALYTSVFEGFEIESSEVYAEGEPYEPGTLRLATVQFAGQSLIIFNSPPVHDFSFTPSMSLYVDMDSAEALDAAFERLSEGSQVLMPLGDYGFSARFGWTRDRFGLSWQLSLPNAG